MKRSPISTPILTTILAVALVFIAFTALLSEWQLALIELVCLVIVTIVLFVRLRLFNRRREEALQNVVQTLEPDEKETLSSFPFPFLICDDYGKITWYNELFKLHILHDSSDISKGVEEFISGVTIEELNELGSIQAEYKGRYYMVYSTVVPNQEKHGHINYSVYFVDNTLLAKRAIDYEATKPVFMHILVDNLLDVSRSFKESEKASFASGIEQLIEEWVSQYEAVLQRISNVSYIVTMPDATVVEMIEDRFSILKSVREYEYKDVAGVTLSIGVGRSNTFIQSEENARQALDLSQGRGGDQAAVNTNGKFEFYGGISRAMDKRTRTKSRLVSRAITELIEASDIVFVMGHRFSDLDALGASIGMWKAANAMGKEAYIVLQTAKTLAGPLLERFRAEKEGQTIILTPQEALERQTKHSLLVIVDTHRPSIVESPALYEAAQSIVVIDHHRQDVEYISNATIFFHDPAASSASEMVTDVLRYMGTGSEPLIGKIEAEALLAGIMLDTRNFLIRTGVQTFEAAAYLRGLGADTVTVKQLFTNSMEEYQLRNAIVSQSDVYRDCAIAIADVRTPDIRIVASQAADELLNISNIKASFVLYQTDNVTNISARSLGDMNVQVLMEMLGGGGHQTMAAVQLENVLIDDARVRLLQSIDQYYIENQ